MLSFSGELTAGFLKPWSIEIAEKDGDRTYPVYAHRSLLLESGIPERQIDNACSAAALMVFDLAGSTSFLSEEKNG
jgi:hypothetical protein